MKKNFAFLVLSWTFTLSITLFAQYPTTDPEYTVTLENDVLVSSNEYEFDIVIRHTGGGTPFECQGIQIGLLFNNDIRNGGTMSGLYVDGSSQMVTNQIPANPSLITMTGNPSVGVFRIAPKAALQPGQGTLISSTGVRMGRFRVMTSATSFDTLRADFTWNFEIGSMRYPTKIAAWILDSATSFIFAKEITVQSSHLLALNNPVLPVELTSFTLTPQGKNVFIKWETKTETNTKSFEIERALSSSNDWRVVGTVNASGTSTTPKEYSFTDKNLNVGKYNYRLKIVDFDGTYDYSNIVEAEISLPKEYAISQNYPNPFNPSTRIDYQLPFDSKVTLELYAVTGEKVATLINNELSAGYYTAEVDAGALNLASGMYIYRMTAQNPSGQNFVQVKKLMLAK